jgi:hypothetical protein
MFYVRKTGFDVSWLQLGTTGAEFSVNDGFDTFQQSFVCRVLEVVPLMLN